MSGCGLRESRHVVHIRVCVPPSSAAAGQVLERTRTRVRATDSDIKDDPRVTDARRRAAMLCLGDPPDSCVEVCEVLHCARTAAQDAGETCDTRRGESCVGNGRMHCAHPRTSASRHTRSNHRCAAALLYSTTALTQQRVAPCPHAPAPRSPAADGDPFQNHVKKKKQATQGQSSHRREQSGQVAEGGVDP